MTLDVGPPDTALPSSASSGSIGRWRVAGLVVAGLVAATLVVLLWTGIDSSRWRVAALLLASLAIATVAALLPTSWRARTALVATTFVAAAGVLPIVVTSDDPEPPPRPDPVVINADYLVELLRDGPFTEPVPAPFVVQSLGDADTGDPGAVARVGAVEVVLANTGTDPGLADLAAYGWIEVYRTETEAIERAEGVLADAEEQYAGMGGSTGDADGFSVVADQYWLSGGRRGTVVVRVDLAPNPNSTQAIASGLVSALLDYSARMTKLAAAD